MKRIIIFILLSVFVFFAPLSGATPKCDSASPWQRVPTLDADDDGRIVGGSPAKFEDNRWQVALVDSTKSSNRTQYCGGTILGKKWILTAAHCIDANKTAKDIAILSGTASLDVGGRRSQVIDIRVHKKFRESDKSDCFSYDIALLKVDTATDVLAGDPITISSVPTVELIGQDLIVTGWGNTENFLVRTVDLQRGLIKIIDKDVCNSALSYGGQISTTMFCAGYLDGRVDPCRGDSGGPAIITVQGKPMLRGIVSWGEGCAVSNLYGVYTDLAKFVDWIKETTDGEIVPGK